MHGTGRTTCKESNEVELKFAELKRSSMDKPITKGKSENLQHAHTMSGLVDDTRGKHCMVNTSLMQSKAIPEKSIFCYFFTRVLG
jgi:hypothetical protein